MKVTTRDLLNYIRCFRFAALDRNSLFRKKQGHQTKKQYTPIIYSLNDVENYEESNDTEQIKKALYWQIFETSRKQLLDLVQTYIFSTRDSLIKADQIFTYDFNRDMTLVAKPDFFVDEELTSSIFLVHAVSGKKLLSQTYTVNNRKYTYFSLDKNNVYVFKNETPGQKSSIDFEKHLHKLSSRHEESGRILYDAAYQSFILGKLYPDKYLKTIVAMLNSDYVRTTEDITPECLSFFDVSNLVKRMASTIETDLYRMINHIKLNDDSRCQLIKNECLRRTANECPYVEFCFAHIPETNSIFDYFQQHLGFREGHHKTDEIHDTYDLINEGMVDMRDIPISWLQRETNLMQRYCVDNDYTFINNRKIKAKLDTLIYPLYFLDFEAYPSVLPRFPGEKCYSQSVFQFSLHIQKDELTKTDTLEHVEFIMKDNIDHREELVKALLDAIPEGKSSIIVYNQAFENNRLQEFGLLFPKFAKRIGNLQSRLFDLLKVLKNDYMFYLKKGYSKEEAQTNNFYHPDMCGSYSLKKILPVFGKDLYADLPVNNGVMAYLQYAKIPFVSETEKNRTIKDLLMYCGIDTLSMAIILAEIMNLTK